MADLRRVKISDLCDIVKGSTGLASATAGKYPLVATGADRKTSSDYQFDAKAVCIPLVSSTGHGKKTLNYVHYQEGKFALGTILAAVIPKDERILDPRYLHTYLQKNKDRVLVPLMKGAANVSLSISSIASIEIPLPSIQKQQELLGKIDNISTEHSDLLNQLDRQAELLSQLRQAVLQEAIEGKLTAEWRCKNPHLISGENHALELIKRIQSEKERLERECKIRKEKPLTPISADQNPFDLPEGWSWCRLGDLVSCCEYGSSSKSFKAGKIPVLGMGNLQKGKICWKKLVFTSIENDIAQYSLCRNDLLFNRTNSRELVGKTALYDDDRKAIFAGYLVRFRMLCGIESKYVNTVMNSLYHRSWCNAIKVDALGQSNINATKLKYFAFPVAPIHEQKELIERVESILNCIDGLEKQVSERKGQSALLMQSILRDAFEQSRHIDVIC